MGRDGLLGAFEELVLLAVAHEGGDAYGMTVRREIERRGGRSVTIGAVYATLDRLTGKGYVGDSPGETGPARRGRAASVAGADRPSWAPAAGLDSPRLNVP